MTNYEAHLEKNVTQLVVEEMGLIWPDEAEPMHAEVAKAAIAEMAAWLTGDEAVEVVAELLAEHGYSDTNIGRCHCGIKTDNLPRHRAGAALAALAELATGDADD